MKKRIQGFVAGVLFCIILMSSVSATDNTRMIEVVEDSIEFMVNGAKTHIPNFSYEGTTYIPIRAISTSLDKTVTWDQETKTAMIEDAKVVEWTDRDMHFDRIHFGDDLDKIKYRIGDPDEIIENDDGTIIYKYTIGPVKRYSLPDKDGKVEYQGIATPEYTVLFYTNGPEQIAKENMSGVYKIDVLNGQSEMIGTGEYPDGTYNGLLKTYGIPYRKELLEDGQRVWYQLPSNKTRYLSFEIKDGYIINHGMEIRYGEINESKK